MNNQHPWCKALAQNVYAVRHMKGMSLRQHAKVLGISPATLSRIERGLPCDLRILAKICEGTGYSVGAMLGVAKVSRK